MLAFLVDDPEEFARLRILHRESGVLVDRTLLFPEVPFPDFASRRICARVEVPQDFYLTTGPTFTVSGRVLTPQGAGLRNAIVSMTDSRGIKQTATSSSFGTYSFANARVGETYVLTVSSRRFRITPRTVVITGNLTDVDLTGLE